MFYRRDSLVLVQLACKRKFESVCQLCQLDLRKGVARRLHVTRINAISRNKRDTYLIVTDDGDDDDDAYELSY